MVHPAFTYSERVALNIHFSFSLCVCVCVCVMLMMSLRLFFFGFVLFCFFLLLDAHSPMRFEELERLTEAHSSLLSGVETSGMLWSTRLSEGSLSVQRYKTREAEEPER